MRFVFGFIGLLCLLPGLAFSQRGVLLSGDIKDGKGEPVSQAVVTIEGTTKAVLSDDKGHYALEMARGQHTIVVSAYGFIIEKVPVEIKHNKELNFMLQKLAVDIESVSVYGKSKSQQVREGAFAVNAIEIRGLASSVNDLSYSIGKSSGVNLREDGGVGADFDLSINGLSGNSIRYFIDGVPLSSMGNGVTLANLPVNIVDHIEVYKGVVPAHLGSDALGGAINIITKEDVSNYIDASYGMGSFCTHKADFNAYYKNPKNGLFVQPSVGLTYSKNNYEMRDVQVPDENGRFVESDEERFHDNYFSLISQLNLGVANKEWADLFTVAGSYSYSDKELQTGSKQDWVYGMATRQNKSYTLSSKYHKTNLFTEGLTTKISLSHTWDQKMVVDTAYRKYYWDGSYRDGTSRNEISGGAKSIRHIDRPLTLGRVNFNYELSKQHVFNVNYLLNHVTNERYDDLDTEFEPSEDVFSKQIIGITYAQKLFDNKLYNTFFLKDYNSYLKIGQQDRYWITGSDEVEKTSATNNLGYGLSSRFRLMEQLAIKASYEHSVRLPLSREYLGNGTTIDPNFNLAPENSENINLGLFGTFHVSSDHLLSYETGLFYRKVEDYIRYVPDKNEGSGQYDNVNNVTIKGVEGEFRYDFKNTFGVIANITYLDERNKTKYQDNGKPEATFNNRMPNRPWLFGNMEMNYRKRNVFGRDGNLLRIAYGFQYVHKFLFTWEDYGANHESIPTQYMNNVQLTYSLKNEKYNISLECKNLLDYTLYDNFKMQKPGRSFFCKFRIFIN